MGVSPSHGNKAGQTALHIACVWANVSAASTLIAAGADINAKNRISGATPAHTIAFFTGRGSMADRIACARLLVAAGVNLRKTDNNGMIPCQCFDNSAEGD